MKKRGLLSGMITGIFLTTLLGLSSCVMEDESPKENEGDKRVEMSFKNDIFYFNRFDIIEGAEDDSVQLIRTFNEQGNIEIYGDVVRIKKNSVMDIYRIKNESYNDLDQIYTFNCDRAIVEFSVTDRKIEVYQMNEDSKEVFYINSTIKSNW